MRRRFKLLVAIILTLALTLFTVRLALLISIEAKLEALAEYYQNANAGVELIADQRGDGSECLIENLPTEIKKEAEELNRYLKIYAGLQSRMYIYISKKEEIGVVIKIETVRRWKDSFFFYYRGDWLFSKNQAYLSSLTQSGQYSGLFGKILKRSSAGSGG